MGGDARIRSHEKESHIVVAVCGHVAACRDLVDGEIVESLIGETELRKTRLLTNLTNGGRCRGIIFGVDMPSWLDPAVKFSVMHKQGTLMRFVYHPTSGRKMSRGIVPIGEILGIRLDECHEPVTHGGIGIGSQEIEHLVFAEHVMEERRQAQDDTAKSDGSNTKIRPNRWIGRKSESEERLIPSWSKCRTPWT
jgi:hypothetical protein